MRKITITSRKTSLFDVAPACQVFIDGKYTHTLFAGKTLSYDLDDNEHYIYCSYNYGKFYAEKSNELYIKDSKSHHLILGVVYSKTYWGRFKENMTTLFTKGYINVPDI